MASKSDLAAIWNATHRDFRGEWDGVRTVLVNRGALGTSAVPLEALTSDEVSARLASIRARAASAAWVMR